MEEREYARIVRLYLDPVYRVSLNCCKNPQDAEDVVQNTFLKLLNTDTVFADDGHVRKWLIRVAVNEANSMWRSFWKRRVSVIDDWNIGDDENAAGAEPGRMSDAGLSTFSASEYSELFCMVQRLPIRYREVVHLYYYEEYSIKEIAEILHISETAIQTRLMRARRKLKEQLKEAWQ